MTKKNANSPLDSKDVKFLSAIVLSSDDAIEGLSLDGDVIVWNQGAQKLYGYSLDEMFGKSILFIYANYSKKNEAELHNLISKVKQGEHVEPYITKRRKKDGNVIDVAISASPIKDVEEKIIGMSVISRPFAGQERVAQYTRSLIEASLDPLVTISPEGKITDVNEATIEVTGVERTKLIGSDFSAYFTEPERAQEGYKLVFSNGKVTNYPLTILHALGKTTDVLYNASLYKDEQGNVLGVFAAARDITLQKQASQYARSLIEASLDPLVTISPEGKITDVNEATTLITGIHREHLVGTDFSNYFTEPVKARKAYEEVFEKGYIKDFPLTIRHKNGKLIDVLYNASVYRDQKGIVLGVFAAARDITAQKRASQYARSLIEASPDPLVTINPEGKITDVNKATTLVTGVEREKLIGSDFSAYFTEPEEAREGYEQVFKEGFVHNYPLAIRHVSGNITFVLYNATLYRDVDGKALGVFAVARDITQRKKVEEQLHAASAYARSLIESSLDPLITISVEGKITDINHATELVTGVSREWLLGSDFSDYFTEPRKARIGYRRVLKEGALRDYSLAIHHASGKIIDVIFNATVYRDATGNVQGVFAVARDVTETKQASQYARSLIEASLDPLIINDLEGKISDVNEAAIKVTGLSREQLIGTDFTYCFTEPDKARQLYNDVLRNGFVKDYPLVIRNTAAEFTNVLCNASIYKDTTGKILGVFTAARDYSRIKNVTQSLENTHSELNAFTYSVAHDLKAPLRAIDNFSNILLEEYTKKLDDEGQKIIKTIVSSAQKMEKLIDDLLAFARIGQHTLEKENVDMRLLATEVYNELKKGLPERNITLEMAELPDIQCDYYLMRQVWGILLSNAIKFSQNQKEALIQIGYIDGSKEITYFVKDNGLGFEMRYIDKLFGIFQRLHGADIEGTGIGLANAKKIITLHNGKIWGEGNVGKGATFYFSLPKAETAFTSL